MEAHEVPRDEVPRRFGSVLAAVSWAYETASKSTHQQPALVPTKRGRGGSPPEDFQDLAYSVLAHLAAISEPTISGMAEAGGMVRAMAADPDTRSRNMIGLCYYLSQTVTSWPVDMTEQERRGMAMVAILRMADELERPDEPESSRRPPKRAYADVVDVPAQSISQRARWQQVVGDLENAVRVIRDRGFNSLRLRLQLAGIVYGDQE
ncbi:hypothetical protein [Halofilum ochraceum]|uniref:hypothetical protein n=1 Tax=Halofilum ochraceum TaxID=1611323 RepID=UPI0008DA21C0|nr:hypothetical protein [Halofilum ochraceum]